MAKKLDIEMYKDLLNIEWLIKNEPEWFEDIKKQIKDKIDRNKVK